MSDSENHQQIKVKGLIWEKRDVWYAVDEATNRSYSIFEEEGKAWAHLGHAFCDFENAEIAMKAVDEWRAKLIRSTIAE